MRAFFWRENLDRRVFAAIRFVNVVDRTPIAGPLQVAAAPPVPAGFPNPKEFVPLRISRNRQGLHIIHSGTTPSETETADELADYAETFDPDPKRPALESLTARLRVIDASGTYLPADFSIALPRASAGRDPVHSVAAPMEVPMFPSPAAPTSEGWAVLRIMVWRLVAAPTVANPLAVRAVPVPGALVRVLRDVPDTALAQLELLGCGLTEWRSRPDGSPAGCAEALVAIRNIPVTTWSAHTTGPVLSEVQPARLEVRFQADRTDPMPDVDALEGNAPGVIHDALPGLLNLRARDRISRHVAFDQNNHLTEFQPV